VTRCVVCERSSSTCFDMPGSLRRDILVERRSGGGVAMGLASEGERPGDSWPVLGAMIDVV